MVQTFPPHPPFFLSLSLWNNVFFSSPSFSSHAVVILSADLELELGELLQEFQDVVEELKAPTHSRPHTYQHVLKEAKSRTGKSDDGAMDDSDYGE